MINREQFKAVRPTGTDTERLLRIKALAVVERPRQKTANQYIEMDILLLK